MAFMKQKTLSKSKSKKYKMTERDYFEKHANLSEDELNEKSNKNVYVKNGVMTTIIKRWRDEKKETKEK